MRKYHDPPTSHTSTRLRQMVPQRGLQSSSLAACRLLLPLVLVAAAGASDSEGASLGASGCTGSALGCFGDVIPAPGVPPVRAVDKLAKGPTASMTVDTCATLCSASGYTVAGITGGKSAYYCYCGCQLNTAAPTRPASACNSPCSSPGQPCGGEGVMSAYTIQCTPSPPPSPVCSNSSTLPAGPACSQAAAKGWAFCDTKASLEDRVDDLVQRITVGEAGALLTARQSPAIPRLGIVRYTRAPRSMCCTGMHYSTTVYCCIAHLPASWYS